MSGADVARPATAELSLRLTPQDGPGAAVVAFGCAHGLVTLQHDVTDALAPVVAAVLSLADDLRGCGCTRRAWQAYRSGLLALPGTSSVASEN